MYGYHQIIIPWSILRHEPYASNQIGWDYLSITTPLGNGSFLLWENFMVGENVHSWCREMKMVPYLSAAISLKLKKRDLLLECFREIPHYPCYFKAKITLTCLGVTFSLPFIYNIYIFTSKKHMGKCSQWQVFCRAAKQRKASPWFLQRQQ